MKTRISTFLTIIALATTTRGATNDLSGLLQKGLFEEEANRNIDAAISNYQSLANAFDKDRQLAATAIFRLGECYRKLGQTNEAAAQYQRIVRDFSDQQTLVTLSRQNLAGLSAAASGSAENQGAMNPVLARLMAQREVENRGGDETGSSQPLRTALARAQVDYDEKKSTLNMLNGLTQANLRKVLPTVITDNQLNTLFSELDLAQQNILKMKADYSENHPQYLSAKEAVAELQNKIDERISGILLGLQAQLDASKAYQDSLRAQLANEQPASNSRASSTSTTGQAPITDEEQQEIRRIQVMIQNSPDLINAPSGDPAETPLCRAAHLGQLRVAKFLIDAKADVNQKSNRMTPLGHAASNGQRAMIQLLLANGADVNGRDSDDCTALHVAADRGFISVAETLLEAKADVNARDVQRSTPLIFAVKHNFEPVSALLLAHGADPNLMATLPHPGYAVNSSELGSPLHFAISKGNERMVSLLLSNRADIELRDPNNKTPLEIAAGAKKTEIARFLLDTGANVNPEPNDSQVMGPLCLAASGGDTNMASLLLSRGADPNPWFRFYSGDNPPMTALMAAVVNDHPNTVRVLLQNKADPNLKTERGSTAFWFGFGNLSPKSLIPLLEYGADPNQTNSEGLSPLMAIAKSDQFSSATDRVAVVKLLIDKGAKVNAKDPKGDTALHLAVAYHRPEMVDLLLANKANVNVANREGKTPLNIATGSQGPQFPSLRPPMFMGVNSGTLTLNNNGANDSTPKIDMVALLREHGALSELPDFNTIRVTRQGSAAPITLFYRNSNDWNQITLFDVIGVQYRLLTASRSPENRDRILSYGAVSQDNSLRFPDFTRIVIRRPSGDGTTKDMKIDALKSFDSGDCTANVPLQFGDVVEIPEADHVMYVPWFGLTTNVLCGLSNCLTRHLKITVKGITTNLTVAPQFTIAPPINGSRVGFYVGNSLTPNKPVMLWPALEESKLLLSSSDLARIKVTRRDSKTGKTREWTVDCSNENDRPNFWLCDGDVIEVPDKPGD